MKQPTFTIFTPTYNRAKCLRNLYMSLQRQTYKDFEWIIVDDGSTDNTNEIVKEWIKENKISITYIYQKNQGKQMAYNKGVEKAKGEFFICIDSDDEYSENALEKILLYWNKIDDDLKDNYAGLTFLSKDKKTGNIIGTKFPQDEFDSNHFDIYYKYNVKGDKGIMFRTNVIKQYKFPRINNEKFITEALIYHRIAKKYITRYINEVLEIKEYRDDGLSKKYIKLLVNNPNSASIYYKEFFEHNPAFKVKIIGATYYLRFGFHSKKSFIQLLKDSNFIFWCILCLPLAIYYYYKDGVEIS